MDIQPILLEKEHSLQPAKYNYMNTIYTPLNENHSLKPKNSIAFSSHFKLIEV